MTRGGQDAGRRPLAQGSIVVRYFYTPSTSTGVPLFIAGARTYGVLCKKQAREDIDAVDITLHGP